METILMGSILMVLAGCLTSSYFSLSSLNMTRIINNFIVRSLVLLSLGVALGVIVIAILSSAYNINVASLKQIFFWSVMFVIYTGSYFSVYFLINRWHINT